MYKTIIIGHLFYFFSQTNRDAKGKIWSSRSSQNLYHHVSRGGSQWEKISLGRIRNLGWVKSETFNLGYVAQTVKRLPTMQETRVQSLGREDLLEKEMAPHSSILAWRISWTEEPGRLQSRGLWKIRHDWAWEIPETEEPGGLPSMGSHRVGHDWSDLACMHAWATNTFTHRTRRTPSEAM